MKLMRGIFFFAFFVALSPTPILSQWTQVNGSFGAGVNCILEYNNVIYIGTSSGMYSSSDNGDTWISQNNGLGQSLEAPNIFSLIVVSNNIYAATSAGVYKYNGAIWSSLTSRTAGASNYLPYSITCIEYFTERTSFFVGTQGNGIYKSSNNGQTWELVSANNIVANALISSGGYISVATRTGVAIYTGDQNWNQVLTASQGILNLTKSGDGNILLAGSAGKVYRSLDHGLTWGNYLSESQTNNRYLALYMNQNASEIACAVYDNYLMRSVNGGSSWTYIPVNIYSKRIQALLRKGDYIFIGTNNSGMVRYSISTNIAEQINSGLNNASIGCLAVKSNKLFVSVSGNGVYVSDENQNNWAQKVNGFTSPDCLALETIGTSIFAGAGFCYKSIDDGTSWLSYGPSTEIGTFSYGGNVILAGSKSTGVYHSLDAGLTWVQINTGLPTTYVTTVKTGPDYYLAGTSFGLFKMTSGTNTWTLLKESFFTGSQYSRTVNSLAINENKIFVGTIGGGLFSSIDGGITWQQFTASMSGEKIIQVNCIFIKGASIFLGTNNGVFYSTNNGDTWLSLSSEFKMQINAISILGNTLYVGTGRGVWKRSITDIVVGIEKEKNIPSDFDLTPNYPNPFNPETTISYQIPTAGLVTLKVFDVLGNEITTLVNEYKQAGTYNVAFNARQLERSREMPSGIYFYRLTSGNYSEVKKMMLIK